MTESAPISAAKAVLMANRMLAKLRECEDEIRAFKRAAESLAKQPESKP